MYSLLYFVDHKLCSFRLLLMTFSEKTNLLNRRNIFGIFMYHVNHDHVYSRLSCYFLIYTKKIHCYHFIYKEECLCSRHLDMFNKMSFLHKMFEALYHICHDVLECPTFHIRTNKSCCYSFNDIVVFLSLTRSPLMPEYKKNKKN